MSVVGQFARQALRPLVFTLGIAALYAGLAVALASVDKLGPSQAIAAEQVK